MKPTEDDDPPPVPPVEPDLDACCGNGCDPCIFDLHDAERERHAQAMRAWRARQAARDAARAEAAANGTTETPESSRPDAAE